MYAHLHKEEVNDQHSLVQQPQRLYSLLCRMHHVVLVQLAPVIALDLDTLLAPLLCP
jgi:hypothetical protein